jgi:hypothetical protein
VQQQVYRRPARIKSSQFYWSSFRTAAILFAVDGGENGNKDSLFILDVTLLERFQNSI